MNGLDYQIMEVTNMTSGVANIRNNSADIVKSTIIKNSIGAAASSLAAGWLPGVGALTATAISVGFIWGMYYNINHALGISISKNKLKSLASALLTNIVVQLGGVVAIEITAAALSLIPGIGSVSASIMLAAVNYGIVYVSGLTYIKMLTKLFRANTDISAMTENEIKIVATEVLSENKDELKAIFEEAQKEAKNNIKSGKITKNNSFDPEKQ